MVNLTKEDLLDMEKSECLDLDAHISMVTLKDRFVVVKRIGKCDYKKCGSLCCKFFCINDPNSYQKNFGKTNEFGDTIVEVQCGKLSKCGSCPLFKTRKFPGACKQFPYPSDGVYKHIMDKCSFKFEIIYTINRIGERIRQEMIKNFEEQW